jgi:Cof subfamily protein (haloacid dehalogenase superfamily)
MNYKIIATDLDGTLLNSKMELSQENKEAILKMAEMGIYFVPCTGRSLSEVAQEIRGLQEARYYITSNGAAVFDVKENKAIIQNCIIGEDKSFLLKTLRKYHSLFTIHINGISYADADRRDHATCRSFRMNDLFIRHIDDKDDFIENFDAFCDEAKMVENCCAFFKNDEDMAACRKELLQTGRFAITASMPTNLEINFIEAGKGVALLALAEYLGIDPQKTIGVGDNINDADSLARAGLGLAVKNARPELLAIADQVVCSNDDHAMKYILENIIMK